jgi:hypothetical protein
MTSYRSLAVYAVTSLTLIALVSEQAFSDGQPIAELKFVETNVDNEPDGQGDYRTKSVSGNVKIVVRAGNESTLFRLYVTYDGQSWSEADDATPQPTFYSDLTFYYIVTDEATIPAIQVAGSPVEFSAIRGIRVTSDDGSAENTLLTITVNDPQSLDVSLVDAEFENPSVLTAEAWIEWKQELIWPENENEDVILYTIGQPGTVPLSNQSIPADFPLAMDANDAEDAHEVWRLRRCSGSWGIRFLFVDFPESRLSGEDDNFATAIFIRGTNGSIDAISDDSYEYLVLE